MATGMQADKRAGAAVFAAITSVVALLFAALGVIVVTTKDSGRAVAAASGPIAVKLTDFKIAPKTITAAAGNVTLVITNGGAQIHNVEIPALGKKTSDFGAGKSETLDLGDVPAGTYEVVCNIPGHVDAGMTGTLVVGGGSGAAPAAANASSVAAPGGAEIDFSATSPEDFVARDPKAPAPFPGTVHELTFETAENVIEVAPGVTQEMWTFNLPGEKATAPGPVLRGKVGDTFRVTLVNKGRIDHSVDFHASKVAWNDEMRSIKPGESLVYEFTAEFAGAYMYHCGTAQALHHIGNGMSGAIIIDPPDLPPVDNEYVLVQGELYTGPDGQPGSLAKMSGEKWDAVVFNGYVNQYKDRPIRVESGERNRVWVIDNGPSENSAFHIVGTVFDTVWKEGAYLLRPDQTRGGSQVLDLQPAQGGFVEFTFAEDGLYPIVTHKFANVGKGALGLFQAGEVQPAGAGGH